MGYLNSDRSLFLAYQFEVMIFLHFFCSIVVSAGIFRNFGQDLAELPLVATSKCNQGKGYFQVLFSCIEKLLISLKVKKIILPYADEAESLWINKLSFCKLSQQVRPACSDPLDVALIFETGTDFLAAKAPSFQFLMNAVRPGGQICYPIPTPCDLNGWILQDAVKEMQAYVGEVKNSWSTTGCSILLDEWSDESNLVLVNILVDCPTGSSD